MLKWNLQTNIEKKILKVSKKKKKKLSTSMKQDKHLPPPQHIFFLNKFKKRIF